MVSPWTRRNPPRFAQTLQGPSPPSADTLGRGRARQGGCWAWKPVAHVGQSGLPTEHKTGVFCLPPSLSWKDSKESMSLGQAKPSPAGELRASDSTETPALGQAHILRTRTLEVGLGLSPCCSCPVGLPRPVSIRASSQRHS